MKKKIKIGEEVKRDKCPFCGKADALDFDCDIPSALHSFKNLRKVKKVLICCDGWDKDKKGYCNKLFWFFPKTGKITYAGTELPEKVVGY